MSDQSLKVDYAFSKKQHYNTFMASAYRTTLGTIHLSDGVHLLDIGCGPGWSLPFQDEAIGLHGHFTGVYGSQIQLDAVQDFVGYRVHVGKQGEGLDRPI